MYKIVTEKAARKIVEREKNVVVIHSKDGCPVCEYFIPEVVEPIIEEWEDRVKFIMVKETLFFPAAQHPIMYFFKNGKCVQHPGGAAPAEAVVNMLEAFYA